MADAPAAPVPLHFFHSKSGQTKSQQSGRQGEVTLPHTHTHTQCICILVLLRGLSSIFNPLQTHLHALNYVLGVASAEGEVGWGGVAALSFLLLPLGCLGAGASSCHFAFSNSNSHMLSVKNDLRWVQLPGVALPPSPATPSYALLRPALADKIFA